MATSAAEGRLGKGSVALPKNQQPAFPEWTASFQRALVGLSMLLQVGITAGALILAWLLRFEFSLPDSTLLFAALPVLLLLRVAAIYRFQLDHGYWRYSGIVDALSIGKAVLVSSVAFFVIIRYGFGLQAFPLSIFPLEIILSIFGLGGGRIAVRSFLMISEASGSTTSRPRAVVMGAGFAGQMLVRELNSSGSHHLPVALLDDDTVKHGALLHGTPVVGSLQQLPAVVQKYGADEVLIAIPSATREQIFRIVEICQSAKIRYRAVPSLRDLTSGKLKIGELRDLDLEDLLGREPIELDLEPVRRLLSGGTVMVTGGAGSIGSELCSQILMFEPKVLLCVDHDETGLFNLEQALATKRGRTKIHYCVEDVGDTDRIRKIMVEHGVDFIFHAAAYKHVPLMERNPRKAVKNNIVALRRLVDAAEDSGVDSFLLISSDKAVHPTNVMGCTKRVGELILSAKSNRRMRCVSVRFGNVLGSQGSVIPLFQQQLREQKPITITHPEITRFFMTTSEAVSLVLQAFSIGEHGDILVLDMGEPISILRMAKTLIHLCGYADQNVQIVYTGLRPGEKLFEELFYESEKQVHTGCEKVLRTQGRILNWVDLETRLRNLENILHDGSDDQIRRGLAAIVPEYKIKPSEATSVLRPELVAPVRRATAAGLD